jgi:hypothetical protein
MKTQVIFGFIVSSLCLFSCSTPTATTSEDSTPLVGRWKLTSEKIKPTNKSAEYSSDKHSMVVLHLQKNGYFMEYDTILDAEWKKKGLHQIERRSKGQWIHDGNTLTLNHSTSDTAFTEKLLISELNDSELKVEIKSKNATVTKVYKK